MSDSDQSRRIVALEMAVAHLEHELEQMHSVLLAVQRELKASREQTAKLQQRISVIIDSRDDRAPIDERPPHY